MENRTGRRLVLMGVAGCGKSTVGAGLSARLGIPYIDGDDLHPAENVARMSRGEPLGDADRWPWLDRVAAALAERQEVIIGCSALRRRYRDRIRAGAGAGGPVTFISLEGSRAEIEARMAARRGHFMPASMVESQFATLEPPGPDEAPVVVDIAQAPDDVIAAIEAGLKGRAG